ncbi:MAG: hypothetical protein JW704_13665 [Anaerolineaceae bacterium]|nr:hypothetical protein [Anaerolineaceae bacterium]
MQSEHQEKTENFKWVYNLEFPSRCTDFCVSNYKFTRVPEYVERVQSLQHLATVHSEFKKIIHTGIHAITAKVVIPQKENKPVIKSRNNDATELDDLMLLLSIFTLRDVFSSNEPVMPGKAAITADPRVYNFGIRSAIRNERVRDENGNECNVGLQRGLESVVRLIRSTSWQKEYEKGRFLILFQAACRPQILETSFLTCWTICEILFRLHNKLRLSDIQIRNMRSLEKIAYVLTKYEIKKSLDDKEKKGLLRFKNIRNTLVHAGRFIDDKAKKDAELFIRVTIKIIARILDLNAVDSYGAQDDFIERLRGKDVDQDSFSF